VEVQGDWIVDAMKKLRDEKIDYCEATHEAEKEWREKVTELSDKTLFPQTKSWYMGDNIPGKFREQLNFAGGKWFVQTVYVFYSLIYSGFPLYKELTRSALDDGFRGFITA
jgi:hypothetical protein